MTRGRSAFRLAVVGVVFALVANRAASQGQNVRLVGRYDTPCHAYGVYVTSGLAYVADGWNSTRHVGGLKIIDVSNPTSPTLRGSSDTSGIACNVHVAGGLAYVADYASGLQIIDVSNPSAAALRGSYATGGEAVGIYVTGGMAYLTGLRWKGMELIGTLWIVDVSNPTSPTLRGSCDTLVLGQAVGVYVTDGLAYVTDGYYGLLEIIDISNPSAPARRGFYFTRGRAYDVYVVGGLAYVACGRLHESDFSGSLQIIDVLNPASPTLRGSCDLPAEAYGVCVASSVAYVAIAIPTGSLQIIDVSNPAAPQFRGSYNMPDYAWGVYVTGGLAYVAADQSGLWILEYGGGPPRLQTATISDVNNNGVADAGDQLVLTLNRSVIVTTSLLRASHFFLPVAGDSLGRTGFRVGLNPYNSRQIVLTMGQGAHLTGRGTFSMQYRTADSPSGIDFATSLPVAAIRSLNGISVVDGGIPEADDSGIDIEFSMMGRSRNIGASGGVVSVIPSADAAYKTHQLTIPRGALATTKTFTLKPPARNLGVIGAVQIQPSNAAVTFASPATVRVEYRAGDIDVERGQFERDMRVHQLVEKPRGVLKYLPVPGAQTLNMRTRQVSVGVRNLNPGGSVGTDRVFAGLPLVTVDERSVNIKRSASSVVMDAGSVVLTPGPLGSYTLHKIEIPNYVATSTTDPARLVVKLSKATAFERESLTGGQSFPCGSAAVFVVTVRNASGAPVRFTDPIRLTIQFKQNPDPALSDVVRFDGRPALAANMRLVRDRLEGEAVDFAFTTAPLQVVNASQGTVTVNNFVGLTGPDGCGTFGAVALEEATPATRWRLYR
jgi:hypothetical protein